MRVLLFYEKIHAENSTLSGKYFCLCMKFTKWTAFIARTALIVYFIMAIFLIFTTIVEYMWKDELVPCMHMYLFGVTNYTNNLKEILYIYNCVVLFLAGSSFTFVDVLIFVVFVNIPLTSFIFEMEMHEFENELEQEALTRHEINGRMIKLISIFKDHKR